MASKYESAFQAAVIDRERQICIDLLRQSPELTLGEIHKLSKGTLGRVLEAISVAELINGQVAEAASVVVAAPAQRERPAGRSKTAAKVGAGKTRGAVKATRGSAKKAAKAVEAKAAEAAPEPKAEVKQAPPVREAKAEAKGEGAAEAKAKPAAAPEVETRTPAGRAAYDESIFAALGQLGGGPLGVAALMKVAGGSNLQARAALNRLIAAGRVTWTGKARGTRYSLR